MFTKPKGRVYVECEGEYDYEETIESLKRVFGIVGICPGRAWWKTGDSSSSGKDVISLYAGHMYPGWDPDIQGRGPGEAENTYPMDFDGNQLRAGRQ